MPFSGQRLRKASLRKEFSMDARFRFFFFTGSRPQNIIRITAAAASAAAAADTTETSCTTDTITDYAAAMFSVPGQHASATSGGVSDAW